MSNKPNNALKDCHILANRAGLKLRRTKGVERVHQPNSQFTVDVQPGFSVSFPSLRDVRGFLSNPNRWGFKAWPKFPKGEGDEPSKGRRKNSVDAPAAILPTGKDNPKHVRIMQS